MKTIRFIHTSDVHLDTSLSASGFPARLGDRKREAIRATFRRILDEARLNSVDMILVAGDLFEHDRVTPDTVEFLKHQFKGLGAIRVFIAPGNHDPFIQGSPYCEETWPENTHIFREEEFRAIEIPDLGVRVAGFGFNRTHMPDHHFSKLQAMAPNLINLVVAHGSDLARVPSGKTGHGPLTIDEIAGKNVRYCALGHYHAQRRVPNTLDGAEVWYSGIPEGRGWDEEGDCAYLLGEISEGRIQIESKTCNQYPLRTLEVNCDEFTSREQVVDAILSQGGRMLNQQTILRVRLLGSVDPRLDLSTSELDARLADQVLQIFWEDRTEPAMDFESVATENTLRGRFARTMNERIDKASGEERAMLDRARLYGLQALLGQEVRLR
jgi:DNA repair exonuclease SbcCD nuclease subunit